MMQRGRDWESVATRHKDRETDGDTSRSTTQMGTDGDTNDTNTKIQRRRTETRKGKDKGTNTITYQLHEWAALQEGCQTAQAARPNCWMRGATRRLSSESSVGNPNPPWQSVLSERALLRDLHTESKGGTQTPRTRRRTISAYVHKHAGCALACDVNKLAAASAARERDMRCIAVARPS
jgi:hypothetical protein